MNDNLDIPEFLRRTMTPEIRARLDRMRVSPSERKITLSGADVAKMSKLRRLRAEERRLSDLIDAMGPRDQARRKRLYDMIRDVERAIDAIENDNTPGARQRPA